MQWNDILQVHTCNSVKIKLQLELQPLQLQLRSEGDTFYLWTTWKPSFHRNALHGEDLNSQGSPIPHNKHICLRVSGYEMGYPSCHNSFHVVIQQRVACC